MNTVRVTLGSLAALIALCLFPPFVGSGYCATTYWTEDFESYASGTTINGKDTSWTAQNPLYNGWTGLVETVGGTKCLYNRFVGGTAWGSGEVIWWNDTGHSPSGLQDFSFSIRPSGSSPYFDIQFMGDNGTNDGALFCHLSNTAAGSANSVDIHDKTLGWISDGAVLVDQWNTVTLRMDFTSPGDGVSLRVNGGTWRGPYSDGNVDCGSLKRIIFNTYISSAIYYDDFAWQAVPEPSSLMALASGLGVLGSLVLRRRRLR